MALSFSGEVKEELLKQYASSAHCIYAELSAIILFGDRRRMKAGNMDFLPENGEITVFLNAENNFVRQKAFTLCKKKFCLFLLFLFFFVENLYFNQI